MTEPRVLALDLSISATGIATPAGSLLTVRPSGTGDRRLVAIRDQVRQFTVTRPDIAVLEDLPTGVRNAAAGALGMLHGVIRSDLLDRGVPYLTVPPATLKVYATGRGNAPKPDLRMDLYKRTRLDVADDNQVDAAWLRLLALDLAGHPALTLPQTHRRALAKLTMPDLAAA
jgi:Holliday junction resolvasome RuvABC endonuclease subunit